MAGGNVARSMSRASATRPQRGSGGLWRCAGLAAKTVYLLVALPFARRGKVPSMAPGIFGLRRGDMTRESTVRYRIRATRLVVD